eukprot:4596372-Lingulodinium_polyedra.AAC.1
MQGAPPFAPAFALATLPQAQEQVALSCCQVDQPNPQSGVAPLKGHAVHVQRSWHDRFARVFGDNG